MPLLRAVLLWLAIIPLAIANGLLRDLLIAPALGAMPARAASGVILGGLVFGWTSLTIPWLGRLQTSGYLALGLVWLVLTISFEFFFGLFIARHTWSELLRAYKFEQGELWPLVLLVIALSPWLAAKLRGLV